MRQGKKDFQQKRGCVPLFFVGGVNKKQSSRLVLASKPQFTWHFSLCNSCGTQPQPQYPCGIYQG